MGILYKIYKYLCLQKVHDKKLKNQLLNGNMQRTWYSHALVSITEDCTLHTRYRMLLIMLTKIDLMQFWKRERSWMPETLPDHKRSLKNTKNHSKPPKVTNYDTGTCETRPMPVTLHHIKFHNNNNNNKYQLLHQKKRVN